LATASPPTRRRVLQPIQEFLATETAGGFALLVGTVIALVWVNGPFGDTYHDVWRHVASVDLGSVGVTLSLEEWVNDALMVVFFFVVGLEVKRELVTGELRDPRSAALPVIAALGGMVVPALIYTATARQAAPDGWGIPVATDIAFVVGALALLGRRAPSGLRIFLLTLAVADDIGGIVIIAIFYTSDLAVGWLLTAIGALVVVALMRRFGVASIVAYVPAGVVAWYAMLESGVHATVAGVALGLLTPATAVRGREVLVSLEHRLAPWSSYVIVPVFAVANAGIEISGPALRDAFGSRITWGVLLGLLVGKTVGISAAAILATRLRLGRLPAGVSERHLVGAAMLGGIGFTVAIFIANLSFPGSAVHLENAKIGVFAGSLASGIVGSLWLVAMSRRPNVTPEMQVEPG